MIGTRTVITATVTGILMLSAVGLAQSQRGRGGERSPPDRSEFPSWENDEEFKDDVFTFARIQFDSIGGNRRRGGGNRWQNDYPDSDLNFSYRLQQLTSVKVEPNGKVLRLTDPDLYEYPFIYMNGVGGLHLHPDEITALRHYLHNGGFLMIDDFWGDQELDVVSEQLAQAVPNWNPRSLPLSHPIFNVVYKLKEKPQVPGIRHWRTGETFEDHGPGSDDGPDFKGLFDNNGRLAVLLCHNNDLGDGWEREGEDEEYFHNYSEKWSYPMGINIVFYVMTH
ncbi:MAG: hypothetical protein ACI92G_001746 [Candidatus Pelagisphaera sp.]